MSLHKHFDGSLGASGPGRHRELYDGIQGRDRTDDAPSAGLPVKPREIR